MARPSHATLLALLGSGLLGCPPGAGDTGGHAPATSGDACTIRYAGLDVCIETDAAGCADWGSRKPGSTHQLEQGRSCAQLGFANACPDGFMHSGECTGRCSSLTTCEDCTSQIACGWCGVGTCSEGKADGLSHGTCTGYVFTAPRCPPPPDPCLARRPYGCTGCTATPGCGWCPASGTCVTGTASGPATGTCPVASWGDRWTVSAPSCPVPDPCATRYGCETCVALAGCGYCASSFSCKSGTASNQGACSDWRPTAGSCTWDPDACVKCMATCHGLPGCCGGAGCICDHDC